MPSAAGSVNSGFRFKDEDEAEFYRRIAKAYGYKSIQKLIEAALRDKIRELNGEGATTPSVPAEWLPRISFAWHSSPMLRNALEHVALAAEEVKKAKE